MTKATQYAQTIDLKSSSRVELGFAEDDISNVSFIEGQRALVTLKSGAMVLLKNIDAASSGAAAVFKDGVALDAQTLALNGTISSQNAVDAATKYTSSAAENTPADKVIALDPLTPLALGVDFTDITGVKTKADEFVLELTNGRTITVENVDQVLAANPDVSVFLNGQVLTLQDFMSALDLDASMYGNADMASLAEQLAAVEPAAGEGAAGAQNSGFTFQDVSSQALARAPNAIGAISPTSLRYGVDAVSPDDAFNVTIDPVTGEPVFVERAQDPTLTVNVDGSDAEVYEDGSVFVPITASLNDIDGAETLSLTITGVPSGWDLSGNGWARQADGSYVYNGLAQGQDYAGGITLSPTADSDLDLSNLTVTATATEATGDSASVDQSIDVIVDAVADAPTLTAQNAAGDEGDVLNLNLAAALNDLDGSETLSNVTLTGIPSGFALSAGTRNADGSWSLSQGQLQNLTITPPTHYAGGFEVTASVTSTESNLSGNELTTGNNSATSTVSFNVSWEGEANPPTVSVNTNGSDAEVYEDGSVFVPIEAALTDAAETLSLRITGIPSDWGVSGAGWARQADGSYVYNGLSQGQNYAGGITLSPPANSDIDLNGLSVTATSTAANGDTATAQDAIDVVVDAVADAPSLTASGSSGDEGDALAINLNAALNDTDGSESLSNITISGVPSGFTLSNGTQLPNGDWSISPNDFGSLSITPPAGYAGSLNLTASVTSTESSLSGDEITTGNNSATTTTNFTVSWADTPELIVENNNDNLINGGSGAQIIVGDFGGTTGVQPTQDYNLNIIVDTSGSLQGQFGMIQNAINNLLNQIGGYNAGNIKVNIIPFGQVVRQGLGYVDQPADTETANATSGQGLNELLSFINGLNAYGTTNYEAALSQAADVIAQNKISGAETYTMFISDGDANTYTNSQGNAVFTPYTTDNGSSVNRPDVLDQIDGDTDGSDEIAAIRALRTEVISVLVNSNPTAEQSEIMNAIDSDGAYHVLSGDNGLNNYADLFNGQAGFTKLDDVGDDLINGGSGDDILFGDVLFTDDLADTYGLGTVDGAGFEVFQLLEQRADWSRADTINYIQNNAESLAEESVLNGDKRDGGNDIINGGSGNDLIFGQEGDDMINGGSGDDDMWGGSGADIFAAGSGNDTIHDFSLAEGDVIDLSSYLGGFNATQDAITDFVRITQQGQNSIVEVSQNGNGQFETVVTLAGATGLTDEQSLYNSGAIAV